MRWNLWVETHSKVLPPFIANIKYHYTHISTYLMKELVYDRKLVPNNYKVYFKNNDFIVFTA